MKKKIKSIFKLRDLEDRIVNLTSGWIATELKNFLETDGDGKATGLLLNQEEHEELFKEKGLDAALIYDMNNSFSDLQYFHKYQVTLDTFYTKQQYDEDDRDATVKRQEALSHVFIDKLWKVSEGVSVVPRSSQKDNLLKSTPSKYRDGNKKKVKMIKEREAQPGDYIIDTKGCRMLLVHGGKGSKTGENNNPYFTFSNSANDTKYVYDNYLHMGMSTAKPLIASKQVTWEKNDEGKSAIDKKYLIKWSKSKKRRRRNKVSVSSSKKRARDADSNSESSSSSEDEKKTG